MEKIKHSFIPTNGINMHVAEIGSGPVVLLLHGFPEIWYSWRHQRLALAHAGFRAIAPDYRGYGLSENTDPAKIDWTFAADDAVGLLDAIGVDQVFVVAKDWGAFVAYCLCFQHPERIRALVVLGIPFGKPEVLKMAPAALPPGHYVRRWMEPGVPEADFGRFDVATVIKRIYILFCNEEMPIASENEHTLDLVKPSDPLPKWMTEEDLRVYVELYEKSGFTYPMEVPYRSWVKSCEKLSSLRDFSIRAPFMLVIGKRDYVSSGSRMQRFLELLDKEPDLLPQLKLVYLDEGTHFMQEQLPKQVNQLMLEFFTPLLPK